MRSPFIRRGKHEAVLQAIQVQTSSIAWASLTEGIDKAIVQVYQWLQDSRAKAIEMAEPHLKQRSVEWIDGFHFGQEWIIHALEELERQVNEKGTRNA